MISQYHIKRVPHKIKELGLLGFIKFAYGKLRTPPSQPAPPVQSIDVFKSYDFITQKPFGSKFDPLKHDKKTINWIIPDFSIGSGGHLNIFRLIYNLELNGFTCRIYIVPVIHHLTAAAAKKDITEHFVPLKAEVALGCESMKPAFVSFATSWHTAYPLNAFQGTAHKFYFVQDFEPSFYPEGSERVWAEDTYKFGFRAVTAGKWLSNFLSQHYGMTCNPIGFSYDEELYSPKEREDDGVKRIFFYARPVTPRRAFELGLLVLNEVSKKLPNVECVFAGWDTSSYVIPFKHKCLGVLPLDQLSDVYSQCDTSLILSFTNLSLLPLELMASGCTVVSNKGANVEWALNETNSVLADCTVEALSDALVSILQNDEKRLELRERALHFVRQTDWKKEADKVAEICKGL